MKNLFRKVSVKVICIALVIALISALSIAFSRTGRDLITTGTDLVLQPMRSVMSYIVGEFEHLYMYMYRYDKLQEENTDLKAQLALMEEEYRGYSEVYAENERLRGLLDLREIRTDYEMEAAVIVSWSSSNFESSFTINRGSANGISLQDCVIDQFSNVVGMVTELSETTAVVSTLVDTTTSMGAVISETNDRGIASGDFSRMQEGTLKLDYLPEGAQLISGFSVVTSGSSGLMPEGLLIGRISDMNINSSGVGDYVVVTPAADLGTLSFVYVITDFED